MDKDALAGIPFGRALAGMALTTLVACPVLALFMFGRLSIDWPVAFSIVAFSVKFGVSVSLPASLVNAAILSVLARFKIDAFPISLIVGGTVGLITGSLMSSPAMALAASGAAVAGFLLRCTATGALMGLLYWAIAVLPQRRRRRTGETMPYRGSDQAIQDAIEQKRDRRIPWDGRIPPE